MNAHLPAWNSDRFDISADMELLGILTKDLESCQMSHQKPAECWVLPRHLMQGTMGDMMAPWCGQVGQLPLADLDLVARVSGSTELIPKYDEFLRAIDHHGLLQGITMQDLAARQWRVMDLGSLMDFLLVSAFYDFSTATHRILEVGGGFGRLADFLALATDSKIQYVNIDAVPVSLMYSYQYLKNSFPEKKVRILTSATPHDFDFDFLILPAWQINKLNIGKFDMSINIESMQEMNQELVDFYLRYFENSTCENGLVYLVNAREYKFKGTWNIPENWQCLMRHRTPRSWTANHPAEIYRKNELNHRSQNMLRSAFFEHEVCNLVAGKLW